VNKLLHMPMSGRSVLPDSHRNFELKLVHSLCSMVRLRAAIEMQSAVIMDHDHDHGGRGGGSCYSLGFSRHA
jgi:hypothetical protein